MQFINKTKINFINKQKFTTILSIILIVSGILSLFIKGGPLLSIDFTGGRVTQIQFNEDSQMTISKIRKTLDMIGFNGSEIVEFGEKNEFRIKTQISGSAEEISNKLKLAFGDIFTLRKIESVGPKIGQELQKDAIKAIGIALMLILLYISFRFDRYYALGSVAALVHDILITLGIFSLFNFEINLSIVAAFLTIVGYSLNDTIVVFDRIRENIPKLNKQDLEEVINVSLNETLNRTLVTSFTTIMVVLILFVWGGEVIKLFSLALLIGIITGTYSSLFIASPVMSYFEKNTKNINQ